MLSETTVVLKAVIKTENDYSKIIALKDINPNEVVFNIKGNTVSRPNKYTIQISLEKHIEPFAINPQNEQCMWCFVNHSCYPNCMVNTAGMQMIAIKKIKKGEEITFDYNTTEYELSHPFKCNCKSQNCINEIKGYKYCVQKF